ncbi:MAG: N-acetyltransferase [Halobacteria archaeon]|nr:N-acetyltransferase [Halobacteria archaeon]
MRYEREKPGEDEYLDEVWELKERIRSSEGYLCQTWEFFSRAYRRNTTHLYIDETVATESDVVGFATVRDDGYILFLGVEYDHRGLGVGRSLVERIEADHDAVTCHTRASNENAIGFYENLGFETQRYIESYYQNGDSAYYLMKTTDDQEIAGESSAGIRNRIAEVISRDE